MFCSQCGCEAENGARFCVACGAQLKHSNQNISSPFEGITPNKPAPVFRSPQALAQTYAVKADNVSFVFLVVCLLIPLVGFLYSASNKNTLPVSSYIYKKVSAINLVLCALFWGTIIIKNIVATGFLNWAL